MSSRFNQLAPSPVSQERRGDRATAMALETILTLSHIRYLLRANMINYAFQNWETRNAPLEQREWPRGGARAFDLCGREQNHIGATNLCRMIS
jgi:hypothetical protein